MITHATLLRAAQALAKEKGWNHITCWSPATEGKSGAWVETRTPEKDSTAVFSPFPMTNASCWADVVCGNMRLVVSGAGDNCYMRLTLDRFKAGFTITVEQGLVVSAEIDDKRSKKALPDLNKVLKILSEDL